MPNRSSFHCLHMPSSMAMVTLNSRVGGLASLTAKICSIMRGTRPRPGCVGAITFDPSIVNVFPLPVCVKACDSNTASVTVNSYSTSENVHTDAQLR